MPLVLFGLHIPAVRGTRSACLRDVNACPSVSGVSRLHEPDGRPSISFCSCRSFSSFAAAAV